MTELYHPPTLELSSLLSQGGVRIVHAGPGYSFWSSSSGAILSFPLPVSIHLSWGCDVLQAVFWCGTVRRVAHEERVFPEMSGLWEGAGEREMVMQDPRVCWRCRKEAEEKGDDRDRD